MEPSDWIILLVVAGVFWMPLSCVIVASAFGLVSARRRLRSSERSMRAVVVAAIACTISLAGLAGGLFTLYLYALGTGLGGYTPPAEQLLFEVAMLSPPALGILASLGSAAWLVSAVAANVKARRHDLLAPK